MQIFFTICVMILIASGLLNLHGTSRKCSTFMDQAKRSSYHCFYTSTPMILATCGISLSPRPLMLITRSLPGPNSFANLMAW